MRKPFIAVVIAVLIGIFAIPAIAGNPSYPGASAFWESSETLASGAIRSTYYSVNIYGGTDGSFVDVYKDISTCEPGSDPKDTNCTDEFSQGEVPLSAAVFSMDRKRLTRAHLDAVIPMQSYGLDWEPVGSPSPTHVVVDWTGTGDLNTDRFTYVHRDAHQTIRERFRGSNREASAAGTLGDTRLGTTSDGYLGLSKDRYVTRTR